MADYLYAADGKIHTRYSELIRCTPGQIDRVVWERTNPRQRPPTEHMDFGIVRHEMFQEEGLASGMLPGCFGVDMAINHIEQEFATEILPGVVLHSRPDAVSSVDATIFDYKTVVNGKVGWRNTVESYKHKGKQRQLHCYAFQLGLHGIRIKQGMFLCEIWSADRDEIMGYEVVKFPITLVDIAPVLPWIKDRIALLSVVLEEEARV